MSGSFITADIMTGDMGNKLPTGEEKFLAGETFRCINNTVLKIYLQRWGHENKHCLEFFF